MKNYAILLLFALVASVSLQAQVPQEGQFELNKKIAPTAPGLSMVYDASLEDVQSAFQERLRPITTKSPKKIKGSLVAYNALVIPEISNQTLDYYLNIESVGRNNSQTRLTLFLSLGNDNFMDARTYPGETANATRYLVTLQQDINRKKLEKALVEAQAALAAQEQALKDLEKNTQSLAAEKKSIEESLKKNLEATQQAESTRATQAKALEELRSKIDNMNKEIQQLKRP